MSAGSSPVAPQPPAPAAAPVSLRVYHEGEKPRNGRLVVVNQGGLYPAEDGEQCHGVTGAQIHEALAHSVDLNRYAPHVYSAATDCYAPVAAAPGHFYAAEQTVTPDVFRLDIRMISRSGGPGAPKADSLMCDSSSTELRGAWFGVGIVRGKVQSNHGTLWRTALQLGASYTFTLGRRYDRKAEGAADVFKSHRQMPCFAYESVAAFAASAPVDAQWVAVEYGGSPLAHFRHPKRAVYILGAEDAGLPPALIARAHHHISIPVASGRPASLNVAAAAAIVMWDRLLKISASSKPEPDAHLNTPVSSNRNSSLTHNAFSGSKRFSAPVPSTDPALGEDAPESPMV